jgi:hypothetical protein
MLTTRQNTIEIQAGSLKNMDMDIELAWYKKNSAEVFGEEFKPGQVFFDLSYPEQL